MITNILLWVIISILILIFIGVKDIAESLYKLTDKGDS